MSDDSAFSSRRLPVYLVLDCSGSMAGEPIAAVEIGIKALLADLRNDPQALETVWLSVITFASTAQQIVPLTDIHEFDPPGLVAAGTTALGEAIDLLRDRIGEEVHKTTPTQKGDWKPLVFVLTDGEPTDKWERPVEDFRAAGLARIVACGAGTEVVDATLKRLGDEAVRLHDTQPGTLGAFMKWVTMSVTTASQQLGTGVTKQDQLPEAPSDKGITLLF
jgi:uncharacterized protein YegL